MSSPVRAAAEAVGCDDARRFQLELEFVQCLANPHYVNWLSQNRYFHDPEFVHYLEYLQYWKEPQYAQYIMCVLAHTACLLVYLSALQQPHWHQAYVFSASPQAGGWLSRVRTPTYPRLLLQSTQHHAHNISSSFALPPTSATANEAALVDALSAGLNYPQCWQACRAPDPAQPGQVCQVGYNLLLLLLLLPVLRRQLPPPS